MKITRVILLFIILFILSGEILIAASEYTKRVIIAGEIDYPPYSFYNDKGEPDGFSIEIARAIVRVMNIDADIVLKPWEQVRGDLEKGKIDIIPGMFYSPERAKMYDFSPPFSIISDSIFARKNGLHADTVEDLRGKEVIVMAGEAMHDYLLENNITDKLVAVETIEGAINLFASGEGDYVLTAKIPGLYWIHKHNYSEAKASLESAESRVNSMIMLYDRLYSTENYRELSVKDYLEPLVREIIGSFTDNRKVTIGTEIDDFILNVRLLSPLGIIVNELLTNIMKYAFTGKDSGKIFLSAEVENKMARIVIRDDGVGIPETVNFGTSTGFGLDLVEMLTEQIEGTIRIERGEGTRFVIEFGV